MYNLENCSLFLEITEQLWAVYHVITRCFVWDSVCE